MGKSWYFGFLVWRLCATIVERFERKTGFRVRGVFKLLNYIRLGGGIRGSGVLGVVCSK